MCAVSADADGVGGAGQRAGAAAALAALDDAAAGTQADREVSPKQLNTFILLTDKRNKDVENYCKLIMEKFIEKFERYPVITTQQIATAYTLPSR